MSEAQPLKSMDAERRLSALRLLDQRKERLALQMNAERQKWRETITESTKAWHKTIRAPVPGKLADCKARISQIQDGLAEREDLQKQKKRKIDAIKTQIERAETAFLELLRSDPDSPQMELDVDEKMVDLGMSPQAAKEVGKSIKDLRDEGAELGDDVVDLEKQLEEMGMTGLRLVDDGDLAEEDSESEEDGDEDSEDEDESDGF